MSKIFLNRNRESLGQFTPEEIAAGLKSGRFLPTDLAWREGMEGWQPLSTLTDIATLAETLPTPPPFESAPVLTEADLPPLPSWEQKEKIGTMAALGQSIKEILFRPTETFAGMRREGGYGKPLTFLLTLGIPSLIISMIWSVGLQLLIPGAVNTDPIWEGYSQKTILLGVLIGTVVLSPILIPLGAFIGSAILHVCLMIVGGAKEPFETTFRVYCYSKGGLSILQIIPICGPYIYIIWLLIVYCIGLKEAHRTDLWRVILAIFLPLLICCGLGIGAGIMIPTMAGLKH